MIRIATDPPSADGCSTPAQFVHALRSLREWSGRSFRQLTAAARGTGDHLPASTVATMLARTGLPREELVAAFVRACGLGEPAVAAWIAARKRIAVGCDSAERPPREPTDRRQPADRPGSTDRPASTPGQTRNAPDTGAGGPPRLLPPDRSRFVGRVAQLDTARAALTGRHDPTPVLLVTGPAGVGKTTFVIRIGHDCAEGFADGQLYADLRGAAPHPADPGTVLGDFLRALGVRGAAVPIDPTERLHLYRTLLARRRVLVVLDDAADATQVRDLLPSGRDCAAVVTSRTSLADLDGARLPLGMLSTPEAVGLLAEVVGADRMRAEPDAARAIVERCGRLPLAVWVAGARLASRPHRSLAALAQALADERHRLDELAVGDVAVRASLELTYHGLAADTRHALHLLGLIRGENFGSWAVAALLDASIPVAERLLDELVEVHLVQAVAEAASGAVRYRLHELVRVFAQERADAAEPSATTAALRRMLAACLGVAQEADVRLSADFQGVSARDRTHWELPTADRDALLADPLGWFDRERGFLTAAVEQGLDNGTTDLAGSLAAAMTTGLQVRSEFDVWRRLQTRALVVAGGPLAAGSAAVRLHRSLGELDTIQDRYGDAVRHFETALRADPAEEPAYAAAATAGLAYVCRLLGRYDDALTHFARAARLSRRTGNLNCLVYAVNGVGVVHLECARFGAAQRRFTEALELSTVADYRPGRAQALRCFGQLHRAQGDYPLAAMAFIEARAISDAVGDRLAATHAACWLGDIWVRQGRRGEGRRLLAESLRVYQEYGNAWGEAAALAGLAHADLPAGRAGGAPVHAERAVRIWRRIGTPYWLAFGLDVLADARRAGGDPVGAARARREAAAIRSRLVGSPPVAGTRHGPDCRVAR